MGNIVFSAAHEAMLSTAKVALLAPIAMGIGLSFTLHTGSSGAIVSDVGSGGNEASPLPTMAAEPVSIRSEFESLARQWVAETTSSSSDYWHYVTHWSYQRIISMGWSAVPFILESLASTPDHWGWALEAITGENPVPQEAAGDLVAITESWLNWGRARKIIS